MNKLSPSLLSADFTHLAEAVEVMEKNIKSNIKTKENMIG